MMDLDYDMLLPKEINSEITITKKLIFQYPEIPNLISVIICVYNSAPYLKQMLDSIYAQTYKKIEIIVAYDTKSSDNSLKILKEYEDKYGLIIDAYDDTTIGFARARGARLAQGEFFIYLDSDDLIIPTYLNDLIECFVRYPIINIAYGGYSRATESVVLNTYRASLDSPNTYSILDRTKVFSYYRKKQKSHYSFASQSWRWLVKRKYLQDIGCFYADIAMREDAIYVLQLLINSEKIGHSSRKGYIYIQHPSSLYHKTKSYGQHVLEFNQYNCLISYLLKSAGYDKLARYDEHLQYNYVVTISFRELPYSEFKSSLKKYGIKHLYITGNTYQKLISLCFNISKWLYWKIYQILGH